MKLDSDFIKQILLTMEQETDYVTNSHTLMQKLKIKGKALERKFMGHILVLGDEGLIDSLSAKYPFGFVYCVDGQYSILDVGYRLTSKGYKMLDMLKG